MKKLSVLAFAVSAMVLSGCDQKEEKAMTPTPAHEGTPSQTTSMNEAPMDRHTVDFTKAAWPGVVSKVEGLSGAEPWGTWSEGDKVIIEFTTPLPERFTVHLTANAFGPNAERDFTMQVGRSVNSFKLGGQPQEVTVEVSNPDKANILTISVPAPTSPKEIGMSEDARKLGIGLVQLKMTTE